MTEMRGQETVGHEVETAGIAVVVPIHDDWDNELAPLDAAGALARQPPFFAKKPFLARFGVRRDQRQEKEAKVDGVADLLLPVVAMFQLAFVEPGPVGADILQA